MPTKYVGLDESFYKSDRSRDNSTDAFTGIKGNQRSLSGYLSPGPTDSQAVSQRHALKNAFSQAAFLSGDNVSHVESIERS